MDEVLRPGEIKPKSSSNQMDIRPFDFVEFPSRGKLYNGTTLEGKTGLDLFYLTAKDEDILTSENLIKSGLMVDYLLKNTIKDKSINQEDLIIGDRNTLLIWLRSTGYGEQYPVQIMCRECEEKYIHNFDLSKLETKYLEEDPDENGLFSFTLPSSKKLVKYKLMTVRDENEITSISQDKKRKMNQKVDTMGYLSLLKTIVSIDGNADQLAVRNFVDYMPLRDSKALRDHISKIEPGLNMIQTVACEHCGARSEEMVPIRPNFFWPDLRA